LFSIILKIPTYRKTLDRVQRVLEPDNGIMGVVDFYAGREYELSTPGAKVSHNARESPNLKAHSRRFFNYNRILARSISTPDS
jgi:hypothetical protein